MLFRSRDDIARLLAVEPEVVVTELVSNGGAFGGKEDMSNQAQTALAAWVLGRPVKTTFSREESFLVHTKRHPIRLEYEAGCDAEGRLTALRARLIGDSGPYASVGMKVLERAAGHASGPYVVPNIDVESVAVRTNNSVCGAFRGFGANQAQFAMEGVIDRLAGAGFDDPGSDSVAARAELRRVGALVGKRVELGEPAGVQRAQGLGRLDRVAATGEGELGDAQLAAAYDLVRRADVEQGPAEDEQIGRAHV